MHVHAAAAGERVNAVVSAGNDGRNRQQAAVTDACELVLEVSRNHVADLAERIPALLLNIFGSFAQHALHDERRSVPAAAQAEYSAQTTGKTGSIDVCHVAGNQRSAVRGEIKKTSQALHCDVINHAHTSSLGGGRSLGFCCAPCASSRPAIPPCASGSRQ